MSTSKKRKSTPESKAERKEAKRTKAGIANALIRNESISVFGNNAIKLYATEVNLDRAVPDLSDGLKPVQRRALVGGGEFPTNRFVKAAELVGLVMGKYHPHGDSSIYGAVVTMVQSPTPLIVGKGNWGSLVDTPAAMRYTNCRLSNYGALVFDKDYYNKEVTNFVPNYSDNAVEPVSITFPLPNILLNGGEGIGVGITCTLPTFTADSVVEVLRCLLKGEKLKAKDFADMLKPSFPWGGQLVKSKKNKAAWLDMFNTPTATVQYEAPLKVDEINRTIVIKDWPWGLNPEKFVDQVRAMVECQSVVLSKGTMEYTITAKKAYNRPQFENFVNKVQAKTRVNRSYKINVTRRTATIKDGVVDYEVALLALSVPQLLVAWLRSRLETEKKSLEYRIKKQQELIAYSDLMIYAATKIDVIIPIIRKSDKPIDDLAKKLKITKEQAQQIMDLRLKSISKLDQKDWQNTLKAQRAHMKQLEAWLAKPKKKVLLDVEAAYEAILKDRKYQNTEDTQELKAG